MKTLSLLLLLCWSSFPSHAQVAPSDLESHSKWPTPSKQRLAVGTPPILLFHTDPEFTEQARRAHLSGVCMIKLIVDVNGLPQNVKVQHPLGLGLDEKAVEAVRKYRFTPAMKDGHPVAFAMQVAVSFASSN